MIKLLVFLLLLSSSNCFSYESEDKLTAVVIGKLAKYVFWNNDSATDAFVITIFKSPFGDLLDTIYQDKKIKSKNIKIQYISDIKDLGFTHILYLPKVNYNKLQQIKSKIKDKNILTVSNTNGFAQKGGIVQIYFESQKLKLKINAELAKAEQLKISSALLRIATIVKEEE